MKKSRIRRVSKKRAKENALYSKLRVKYLDSHPACEACDQAEATEIHHMLGRTHGRLNEVKYFLGVCQSCHRYIHEHPEEARKVGWILDKFNPENKA